MLNQNANVLEPADRFGLPITSAPVDAVPMRATSTCAVTVSGAPLCWALLVRKAACGACFRD